MDLTEKQKKFLRGLGHDLKPTVFVGTLGITPKLIAELDQTLDRHELIKVKVRVGERSARDIAISDMTRQTGASLINRIGNIAILYRRNDESPRVLLS